MGLVVRGWRRKAALAAVVALSACAVGVLALTGGGSDSQRQVAALPDYGDPRAIGAAARRRPPQVVEPTAGDTIGVPAEPDAELPEEAPSPGGPSAPEGPPPEDAQIRRELREGGLVEGARANLTADGRAVAPLNAPPAVIAMIAAGNQIAHAPYRFGGGHATWEDTAFDCSGSISYALAAAGLLTGPLNSTGLVVWGQRGPGRWVTIYGNPGHAFMVVAGLRFDTSGRATNGSRWQRAPRSTSGFSAVHPPGL